VSGEFPKLPKRQQEVWNIIGRTRELPLQELVELAETTTPPCANLKIAAWLRLPRKFPNAIVTPASTSCRRSRCR